MSSTTDTSTTSSTDTACSLTGNSLAGNSLTAKKCVPCEGGVPLLTQEEIAAGLALTPSWELVPTGLQIRRTWRAKNFVDAMRQLQQITTLAEEEGHHPDFHLTNYRDVAVEIWTHAIGGLSENDFILAAKIDQMLARDFPKLSAPQPR